MGKIFDEVMHSCVDACDATMGYTWDVNRQQCVDLCPVEEGKLFDEETGGCQELCETLLGLKFNVNSRTCSPLCLKEDGLKWNMELQQCVDLCDTPEVFFNEAEVTCECHGHNEHYHERTHKCVCDDGFERENDKCLYLFEN